MGGGDDPVASDDATAADKSSSAVLYDDALPWPWVRYRHTAADDARCQWWTNTAGHAMLRRHCSIVQPHSARGKSVQGEWFISLYPFLYRLFCNPAKGKVQYLVPAIALLTWNELVAKSALTFSEVAAELQPESCESTLTTRHLHLHRQQVWTTCPELLLGSAPAGHWTVDLSVSYPAP